MGKITSIIMTMLTVAEMIKAQTTDTITTAEMTTDSIAIHNNDSTAAKKTTKRDSAEIMKLLTLDDCLPGSKPHTTDTTMYFTWKNIGPLGLPQRSVIDSTMDRIYVANIPEKTTIAFADHASLGSPGISLIYTDRVKRSDYLFFAPYMAHYVSPRDVDYFNTKKPYSKFTYKGAGPSNRSDQCVGGIFTVNAGKKFNFGMYGDWVNSYGAFESTSTRNCNAGIFTSYMGRRNYLMLSFGFAKFENYENGGLLDEDYIRNPEDYGDPSEETIPVNITGNTFSKLRGFNIYTNYKYHIGFDKEFRIEGDSVVWEYLPVVSVVVDAQYESDWKRYNERSIGAEHDTLYNIGEEKARFLNNKMTLDSTKFRQLKMNIGLNLNEEFNKLMKFGFGAYYALNYKKYYSTTGRGRLYTEMSPEEQSIRQITDGVDSMGYIAEPIFEGESRTKMGIGAVLSKHSGKHFFYNINGEYYFLDEKRTGTSFMLQGEMSTRFNVLGKPMTIGANAKIENECPDFFEEHYYSNYFVWNKNFENKRSLNIGGNINIEKIGFSAKVNYANLGNYIYFDKNGMPAQMGEAINVLTLTAAEKLKLWWLHWDNELAYQETSDEYVMPLPRLSWMSHFYLRTPAFFKKSLTLQIGAELRYYTKYYASRYMPATGMFYVQDKDGTGENSPRQYGSYPYISAYAAMQLKVLQFYVTWNHLNQSMGSNRDYMASPGYAMNPSFVRIGLAVTFDD